MLRRLAAVAGIGVILAPALALGTVYSAGATDMPGIYDYRQTLPASVIDGLDLDYDQKQAVINNTRSGVVGDRTVVPLGTGTSGPRGLYGTTAAVSLIGGVVGGDLFYDRNADRPEWIDAEEWNACAQSSADDWTGNLFDGLRDWTASFGGVDCNDVRAGWDVEKDPDYEPIGFDAGPVGYPLTVTKSTGSLQLLQPYWSDLTYNTGSGPRKEGWVLPMNRTGTGGYFLYLSLGNAAGQVPGTNASVTVFSPPTGTNVSQAPCTMAQACVVLDRWLATTSGFSTGTNGVPSNWYATGLYNAYPRSVDNQEGNTTATMPALPFVNTLTGTYTPGLTRQQVLTSVTTESGQVYQCRTESFVETAPMVPRPCEPTVPPGEVITERRTEVVPETDTGYVPGSNPTRTISTTEVPDVVRDWQRENDEETLLFLDLELEGVGNCYDHPEECADWYTDPNKAAKYTCKYGGKVVSLAECYYLARLFKNMAIAKGAAYPDPAGKPGSNPDPSGEPASGQTSSAPAPAVPAGSAPADANKPRNCFPTGWAMLNPFEWVFKPVRCALEWAFVPRDSVLKAQAQRVQAALGNSVVGRLGQALASIVGTIPASDGGCGGIPLHVEMFGTVLADVDLLNSCGPPLDGAAAVTKSILTAGAITAAVLACSRYVANIFGFVGYGQLVDQRAAEAAERKVGKK